MIEWWNSLEALNQWFYGAALFFTVIFLWQFISSLIGLGGEAELDLEVDADVDLEGLGLDDIEAHSIEEVGETGAAFKILSLRAVLAFCTMFTWATALYLSTGKDVSTALFYAIGWGSAGWVLVALLLHWLRKLTETGTQNIATCVGRRGTVYLDIPPGGQGEVRVLVSGRVTMVKARSADGDEIGAGAPVRIVRAIDTTTVEVQSAESKSSGPDQSPGKETEQ